LTVIINYAVYKVYQRKNHPTIDGRVAHYTNQQ